MTVAIMSVVLVMTLMTVPGILLCGSNTCIGLTFEGSDDCCCVSIETNTLFLFLTMNTRKDPSATEQMIAVTTSVEKVKETVTGTVTVLAFWSVALQTVLDKGLMIMMIAVRNLTFNILNI